MSLRSRVKALAKRIRLPEPERRVILCWEDEDNEGHLTKVSDTHPELPDDGVYQSDMTQCVEETPQTDDGVYQSDMTQCAEETPQTVDAPVEGGWHGEP